jgi:hypothetical protein
MIYDNCLLKSLEWKCVLGKEAFFSKKLKLYLIKSKSN